MGWPAQDESTSLSAQPVSPPATGGDGERREGTELAAVHHPRELHQFSSSGNLGSKPEGHQSSAQPKLWKFCSLLPVLEQENSSVLPFHSPQACRGCGTGPLRGLSHFPLAAESCGAALGQSKCNLTDPTAAPVLWIISIKQGETPQVPRTCSKQEWG